MRFLLQLPGVRSLQRRQLLFPLVVVLVVAGVLAHGALDRSDPDPVARNPNPAPVARLVTSTDLDKAPLAYISDYWYQLADQVQPGVVLIGPGRVPGLLVGSGLALTTGDAVREARIEDLRRSVATPQPDADASADRETADPESIAADPEAGEALEPDAGATDEDAEPHRLRTWDVRTGLALFEVDEAGLSPFTLSDPRRLPSGSHLGAVTLDSEGRPTISPGYLVGTRSLPDATEGSDLLVSMDQPATSTMTAIVDLDGVLVGAAFESPDGVRVVTSTTLLTLIDRLQTGMVCRGVEVSDLDDAIRARLSLDRGVLVEHVRADAFNTPVSLVPGDIVVTWAGDSVTSADQFRELYDAQPPGELVSYRALRAGRRVTGGAVMPGPDCAPLPPEPVLLPRFGLAVREIAPRQGGSARDRTWRIAAVAPQGPAALAGVLEGDLLHAVNGLRIDTSRVRAQLEAAAESDPPLVLDLRREGRARLVAVPLPEPPVETDAVLADGSAPQ